MPRPQREYHVSTKQTAATPAHTKGCTMTQTAPFSGREVIYILDPPKAPTNGFGVAGFTVGILGLFTFGLLSPIGLILSFIGLFKKPKGFAAAGFAMSLVGVSFIGTVTALPFVAHRHHQMARADKANQQVTRNAIRNAVIEIEHSQQTLPSKNIDGFQGNAVTVQYRDAWGNELRFDERNDGFAVRSAGPDQNFDTADDLLEIGQYRPITTVGRGNDKIDRSDFTCSSSERS